MSWSVIVAFPGNTHLLFGTEMSLDFIIHRLHIYEPVHEISNNVAFSHV